MKAVKLREHFYWTGILDEKLRVFDIIMYTEFGTTYNSYVMQAGDKTILFETAKAIFVEEYLEKVKEVADLTCIDYLVVSHTEPDHAGSVERLLEYSPQMKILATSCALGFLKEIVNKDFVGIAVKDDQEMSIGNKTLRFLAVPNLHWPDTMYTFIEEEQILVTCDSFGSHYCLPEVVSGGIQKEEEYQKALKYYYDNIIGPFKPYMQKALDKIQHLDITMICTGHGPVLVGDRIRSVIAQYRQWSQVENPNRKKTVVIPYVSAYGYTGQLAERIGEGIRDSGDVNVRIYNMVEADAEQVGQELLFADGILLGTPTIVGEALKPIWELTLGMFPVTHGGKYAGAFGSYGWSGEGVPNITQRLKQLKMKVMQGFRVRFKPNEADLISAYEYGFQFGCMVQEKEPIRPQKQGSRQLVKCLVCGEIFDASLDICPVCGVGRENFVPVEARESGFSHNTREKYVILGNGAAGYYAAKAIRERDRTGTVTLISREPYPAYNRPMLTKALVAGLSPEQIAIAGREWYEDQQITQMLGKRVEAIDQEKQEVVLADKSRVPYTRLIYALGSECFIPPIEGRQLPEVCAIRSLGDVRRLESLLKKAKGGVVIGGGVLGLEAAWELKKAGLSVTVLETAPVLMGRQLDQVAGRELQQLAKKQGIAIYTGVQVKKIQGKGHVTGVQLEDGPCFEADLVVISTGVRPNVELARQMGLHVQRGVVVNSRMETNIPYVYACGDCAEYQGMNYGVWAQAVEQGETAGANAAGEELEYTLHEPALTFHGMNTALYAAGDNGKNPELYYKTVELQDMGKGRYQKYYFRNNRLCGVILLGDLKSMPQLSRQLEEHATYEEVTSGE
ncbi:MAG: FAD-dependent oxidoreductase [Lachnospiraceae bacterium]|nr:FAD-dependent oxidoreductase [Lachnospiraceae bacterium]